MLPLGENLARIRTARGFTQDELARVSGVSVDTISRLERGAHATARRSTIQALALALIVGGVSALCAAVANPTSRTARARRRLIASRAPCRSCYRPC